MKRIAFSGCVLAVLVLLAVYYNAPDGMSSAERDGPRVSQVVTSARGSDANPEGEQLLSYTIDPDADALVEMAAQAAQMARDAVPDAVLRQVDVVQPAGDTVFRFVSPTLKQEIDVYALSPSAPPNQWRLSQSPLSPLTYGIRPGIDVGVLKVGPLAARQAVSGQWPGCSPRSLTLGGEGDRLTWYAFCTLSDGRVAEGTIDGRTGEFRPSDAPPVLPPPTALPSP